MALVLSESTLKEIPLTEQEAWLELAMALYAAEEISQGRGKELAGVPTLMEFWREMAERGLYLNYSIEDWEKDMASIGSFELARHQ